MWRDIQEGEERKKKNYLSFHPSSKDIGLTQDDLTPRFDSQLLVCKLKGQL